MYFPAITALYAALLAIVFVTMSAWVVLGRVQTDVMQGDGGNDTITRRMRAQGNFAEYVPYALLLIALLEAAGASHALVHLLCLVLLISRLMHPFGMLAAKDSPQQYVCRGGGIVATFLVILVAAISLLVRVA